MQKGPHLSDVSYTSLGPAFCRAFFIWSKHVDIP